MLVQSISQIRNNKIQNNTGYKESSQKTVNNVTLPSFADAKSFVNMSFKAAIHRHAKEGFLTGINRELFRGNVNKKNSDGETALMIACKYGKTDVVESLLRNKDIDVNAQDNGGYTALIWASYRGDAKVVEKLLEHHDIDVNAQNEEGDTALIWASYHGDAKVVEKLLQHPDIDVNVKNKNGNTALIWASINDNADVVEKLLQHPDIDINAQDDEGNTALIWASHEKNLKVVEKLLQHPDINIHLRDIAGRSALDYAIDEILEMIKAYKKVVDKRAGVNKAESHNPVSDINLQDDDGNTSLISASRNGNIDEVEKLLQHPDIDVNVMCKTGFTPLSCACARGYTEIVEKLLQHPNIDVNVQNGVGITALMWASSMGHAEVVEQLIKHPDIDVNIQDIQGNTALIWASNNGYANIVEKLLEHPNVDITLRDNERYSALHYANLNKYYKIAQMIENYTRGVDNRNSVIAAQESKQVENINALDKNGNTPLMAACIRKDYKKLDELLKNPEIDVNTRNGAGSTVLIGASNGGLVEAVEKLLLHPDIDVNAQSYTGNTALIWASYHGHTKVVEKLLEHPGVDIGIKDDRGRDALSLANDEIAQMIKNYRRGFDQRDHSKMYPSSRAKWDKILPLNSEVTKQQYEKFQQELEKIKAETEKTVRNTVTKTIRQEENLKANQKVEAKIAELDKTKEEYNQKNKALDNLINNYQLMLAEDIAQERENLESNFRTLYGVKSENLPDNMGFGEQMLYVVDILTKNKNKLSNVSNNSPKNITKALQDNNGQISNDGLKFIERIIEVSNSKCSEQDLISSINAVKNDKGLLDMDKISYFIASLAWSERRISDVVNEVKEYDPKKI